jgi:hypothetical protein
MNRILSSIRSVPGVWGTLAIDKRRALTYQLLPSTYNAETVKKIALPALNLGQQIEKSMLIDLFFENGKARIYNRPEAVVLIMGRFDMDFDMLGSVCKEAVPAICRRFARARLGDNSPGFTDSGSVSFDFLLKAINILASNVQQKIGAYLVTKHLRNSKDFLVGKYPFLSSITVDNNGVASLIRGSVPHKGDDLLQGFAHWANLFIASCAKSTDKLNAADILELTIELKDKLEMTGFYQLYADIGL